MKITKSKTPPPSFVDRLNGAEADAGAAVSILEGIACDLSRSADEKSLVIIDIEDKISELHAEISTLENLAQIAEISEGETLAQLNNVRALLSA